MSIIIQKTYKLARFMEKNTRFSIAILKQMRIRGMKHCVNYLNKDMNSMELNRLKMIVVFIAVVFSFGILNIPFVFNSDNPLPNKSDLRALSIKSKVIRSKRKEFSYSFAKFDQAAGLKLEAQLLKKIPSIMRSKAKPYIRPVIYLARKHKVNPFWMLSIIWTESHFNPIARSHVGAQGLMQILPGTYRYMSKIMRRRKISFAKVLINKKLNPFFVDRNHFKNNKVFLKKLKHLEVGIYYLKHLKKRFRGNELYATVAYNMGPTWTRRMLRSRKAVGNDNQYVRKVTRAYKQLVRAI